MHTDDGDCTIVWYPTVGMKHIWQVYVTSDLKTMLFCFLSTMAWIFMGMESKCYLSTGLKLATIQNEPKPAGSQVIPPTTSNIHSRPINPKPCPQPCRLCEACY